LMRWPTTQRLGRRPTCLLSIGLTWSRITGRHNPLLRLATQEAPIDPLVQAAREVGPIRVARTQDPVGLDDLGGKTYRILQHPSMLKLFSGRPHSDVVARHQEGGSLCHRSGEACLPPHQAEAEVYSQ
jgi:hypothetical protein